MTSIKETIVKMYGISVWLMVCATVTLAALPAPSAVAHGAEVLIEGVPLVKQSYPLSCEYAAATAVTLFWGGEVVSEEHFIREVPRHPNPHLGFRGDITGTFGGITD